MITPILGYPVIALMGFKALRAARERRAAREGFITFGGEDAYPVSGAGCITATRG